MARPIIVEGQTATNPTTGSQVVYAKGRWYPVPAAGAPGAAPGAPGMPGGAQTGDAQLRGRLALGLSTSVDAQKRMQHWEDIGNLDRTGPGNPLGSDWGATALESMSGAPVIGGAAHGAAQIVGGDDYQSYTQAAKTFESSLLPVFSGSAVTPSEAARFIAANLPQASDNVATLKEKARNRAMILNGAAKIAGTPIPFPDIPTWGVNAGGQAAPAAAGNRPSLDQIFGH